MRAAGLHVAGYHASVPSFRTDWGFALASPTPFQPPRTAPPGLRFLNDGELARMFQFGNDMQPLETEVNRLDNQILVRYYEDEWRRWTE